MPLGAVTGGPTPDATPEAPGLAEALSLVGDRWSLLVVHALLGGPRRFGELLELVPGIASNVLADRLRRLQQSAVVLARPYSRRPPRVAYELTGAGRDLADALRLLAAWGARRAGAPGPRHAACGTSLQVRWYCPTCGRLADHAQDEGLQFL